MTTGTTVRDSALIERLSFRADVRLERDGSALRLTHCWGSQLIRQPSDLVAAALHRLTAGPATADELADYVLKRGDSGPADADMALVQWTLDRLQPFLVRSLWADGRELMTVVPIAPWARLPAVPAAVTELVRLSRFTYLHRRGDVLVAESPLSPFRLELGSSAAVHAVAATAGAVGAAGVSGASAGSAPADAVVSWLVSTGMAEAAARDGDRPRFSEDDDPVLRQWDFHDLLFHARSRLGRHCDDFGATFPFVGELDPAPALRPIPAGTPVPLARPDLDRLLRQDAPLAAVMEARRSVRSYAEQPPTAAQIGELLYRTARVRAVMGPDPARSMPYEASDRPYPSGGAAYELELYLTINRCGGLPRGNYYYDPAEHRLILLNQAEDAVQGLLQRAYVACAGTTVPDVLITMTARFQRLGWKYRGMAYAATLKHVGVLYQTLYLAATAMGLAPCGLGSGDADMAARAFGLEWARESSVGEFMIGSGGGADPVGKTEIHGYRSVQIQ